MAFILNLFKSKPVPPERVPTDTIIPLNSHDDNHVMRAIALQFSMRFDDVLDAEKLAGALQRLLERPGWRRMGARLRLNDQGKLEYHVPQEYTKERPSVDYTHAIHDMPAASHPIARRLPRSNNTLFLGPVSDDFRPLVNPPRVCTELKDWIYQDSPQLQLHIVSFHDTTLVTLSWLHTLLDALGRNALLRAWVQVLEGRDEEVPDFYAYDFDPLATLGDPPSTESAKQTAEPYLLHDKRMSTWQMLKFGFNFMWEMYFYPLEQQRVLCIPSTFFKKLHAEALSDLQHADPSLLTLSTTTHTPFLSEGDVLGAWFTRLILQNQPWTPTSPPKKTIHFSNVFGMRDILTSTSPPLLERGKAYIGNCANSISSFFTLHEFLTLPLGHIAARIRADLVLQASRAQIEAKSRITRQNGGNMVLYGDADMCLVTLSNWTKAKLFETDFSAAVVREGKERHARGRPSYIHADGRANGFSLRNAECAAGRDWEGNYWVGGSMRVETWENVERAIQGMS